jgi:hypothetical protein
MTPKEKAKELVDKYMNINKLKLSDYSVIYTPTAKQCALIAVDEIIILLPNINETPPIYRKSDGFYFQYWQEVKQEIEKL